MKSIHIRSSTRPTAEAAQDYRPRRRTLVKLGKVTEHKARKKWSKTDRAKGGAALKDSCAHARKAITGMPDANLEKSLDWFGGKNTQRGILLFIVRHAAEHLGQSISYARSVGIVPPWTEDSKKAQ